MILIITSRITSTVYVISRTCVTFGIFQFCGVEDQSHLIVIRSKKQIVDLSYDFVVIFGMKRSIISNLPYALVIILKSLFHYFDV